MLAADKSGYAVSSGLGALVAKFAPWMLFAFYPLAVLFVVPDKPLSDPGMGWHLVTGQWIIDNWTIPRTDFYSHTAYGSPWILYEWLFQVVAAWMVGVGGLPLLTSACVSVYSLLPVLLFRRMEREGADTVTAFFSASAFYTVLLMHGVARPHIFTYLFFILFESALDSLDRDKNSWPAWKHLCWMMPVMAVWANVHGGFCVGLVLVGLYGFASVLRWIYSGRSQYDLEKIKSYAVIMVGSLLASAVNPYGLGLHSSVLDIVHLKTISIWQEFSSPNFHAGGGMSIYLALLIGLVVLLSVKRGALSLPRTLLLLFFFYYSLRAVRHVFLFVLVAGPVFAAEVSACVRALPPRWARLFRHTSGMRINWTGILFAGLFFILFSLAAPKYFKRDLGGAGLSLGAIEYLRDHAKEFQKPFNTTAQGGAIIYHFKGQIPVFCDDRADVYGDDFWEKELFEIVKARPKWKEVLARHGVTSAIMPAHYPATTLLEGAQEWKKVFEDEKVKLFVLKNSAEENP